MKTETRNIEQIVHDWLLTAGYDGLTDDAGCGCLLRNLRPCGSHMDGCYPAYDQGPKNGQDFCMERKPKNEFYGHVEYLEKIKNEKRKN